MIFKEFSIDRITVEDKQLLYDAMIHYMYAESKIGRSNHFAADLHRETADYASKVAIGMRDAWDDIVH